MTKRTTYFIQAAGTEIWIKIAKAEVEYLKKSGVKLDLDYSRENEVYVSVIND